MPCQEFGWCMRLICASCLGLAASRPSAAKCVHCQLRCAKRGSRKAVIVIGREVGSLVATVESATQQPDTSLLLAGAEKSFSSTHG